MRFLIIDDEPLAQRVIEKYAHDIPTIELAGKCNSAFEAMEFLHKEKVDLLFLDINMPKLSGLDFLKSLQNPPIVIITTAYREYALESYDLDAIDYLKKPFSFERFYKAIQKAQSNFSAHHRSIPSLQSESNPVEVEFLFIKADGKIHKIDYQDILLIEAYGDYIKIHTLKKTLVTYFTMKKISSMLPSEKFPRVHKSYIVSFNKIDSIEGNTIVVGENKIPIGKSYRKDFFDLIPK